MEKINMSEKLDKLIENIPDVWFDWYGRLIPGCIGMIIYIISFDITIDTNTQSLFLLLFLSYLLGHIIQPISSEIINLWSKKIQIKKNPTISKAYAELIGFCSISIITFILLLIVTIKNNCPQTYKTFTNNYFQLILLIIFFVISVFLRKKALIRKIEVHLDK